MLSRPDQRFSQAWAEVHLGFNFMGIWLMYPERIDLDQDLNALTAFHRRQTCRSDYQLRIEKTKRGTAWLELSCWSRNHAESVAAPKVCLKVARHCGDRLAIIQQLQNCVKIEVCFMCLEEEEDADKRIKSVRKGYPQTARGTEPIELKQMRIFGRLCRASYAIS